MAEAKFGSVEWQKNEMKRITRKILKNEPLDAKDRIFLDVQYLHNKRIMRKLKKAV